MSWDTSRYLSLFIGEATEHLEALSRDLVQHEQGGTPELIASMFRHAHSVKGMSASMGLDPTAALAHNLEDLLDALRGDAARLDGPVGDLVLKAVDTLTAHVKAAAENKPPPNASSLVDELRAATATLAQRPVASPNPTLAVTNATEGAVGAVVTSGPATAVPSFSTTPVPRATVPGHGVAALPEIPLPPRYQVKLRVTTASAQPGVRGFLAYKRLSLLGNVFDLSPPLEDIKAGRMTAGSIRLELETSSPEAEVVRTIATIAEIELESIRAVAASTTSVPVVSAPPAEESARLVGQEPARTVRIKTELLDTFLDATGELLLATARVREVGRSLGDAAPRPLEEAVDRLHGLVRDLHVKVMQARMTPLAVITDRLPRAARDIARRRGRDLELSVTGSDIELDRAVVDELADPLLHLLRNAVDHGIEPPEERKMRGKGPRGHVKVTMRRVRDRVELDVEDDGRGIDAERLKTVALERGLITSEHARTMSDREAFLLCFLPGVSTASDVTDISGRGVGMDAVKRVVESVGGSLDVDSQRGRGTRVRLSLPVTVSMVTLLLVGVGDDVYGLPITKVAGVVETPRGSLSYSGGAPVLHFGASVVPVHELTRLLELPYPRPETATTPFVVVDGDEGRLALAVDRLVGQEEVVLKSLARPLDLVPGLAGVTILGTGRPVFILDVARLLT